MGQLPIDVEPIGCDMLSATGRKYLRGPRGTGFLYVRDSFLDQIEPPFLDLHAATWTAPDRYEIRADARRFENWETNYAAKIGLGVAVDYALVLGAPGHRGPRHRARRPACAQRLASRGRRPRPRPGQPPVRHRHLHHRRRARRRRSSDAWRDHGVNVSVSLVDYARLDLPARGLPDLVRASVHYYNTDDELDRLVDVVSDLP